MTITARCVTPADRSHAGGAQPLHDRGTRRRPAGRIWRRALWAGTSCLALLGTLPGTVPAHASGLALRDTDPVTTGNAYIGGVSRADDATTAYLNPAGMAWLDDDQIENSVTYIVPHAEFSGGEASGAFGTVNGRNSVSAIDPAATGSSFGVFRLGDRWRVGYGFTTPYGERADYPSDWVGRFNSLVTSITVYNLSAAVSYKVNDHLSIGVGPQMNFAEGRFTQGIDLGPLTSGPLNQTVGAIDGNGFGFGYYAGLMYRFDDRTQLGIDYRSRTTVALSGKQKITSSSDILDNPFLHPVFVQQSGHLKAQITLPDTATIGLTHWITPRLAVMVEGQWTHWSLLQSLNFQSDSIPDPSSISIRWRNTWMGGIGATYRATQKLTLRTGFSYDESPATDAVRNTRTPDTDRYMLAAGLGYQLSRRVTVNAAYGHIFTPVGTIAEDTPSPVGAHILTGTYNNRADVATLGMIARF